MKSSAQAKKINIEKREKTTVYDELTVMQKKFKDLKEIKEFENKGVLSTKMIESLMFAYKHINLIDDFFEIIDKRTQKKEKWKAYYEHATKKKGITQAKYTKGILDKIDYNKIGLDFIKDNLNLYKGKELKIKNEYISGNQIDYIWNDLEKKTLITSPTGSGKTTSLLNYAKENDKKIIFLSPYSATTEQTYNTHKKNCRKIIGLFGSSHNKYNYSKIEDKIKQNEINIIIATYDKSKQIYNLIEDNEFTLIVDEAHNTVSQQNFRYEAIKSIRELEPKVKNTLHVTATPLGLDLDYDKIFNFTKDRNLGKANIVQTDNISKLLNLLVSNRQEETIDIIRINNIGKQKEIKKTLVTNGFYNKKEILILNSKQKDTEEYKYLINKQKILNGVKLVLTTSLIDDGVNIKNENINNIFYFASLDINSLVQFPSRARKGIKGVMYFFSNIKEGKQPFRIDKQYNFYYDFAEKSAKRDNDIKEINPNYTKSICSAELIKGLEQVLMNGFVAFDDRLDKYVVDNQQILYTILRQLNGKLSPSLTAKVLKEYANFSEVVILDKVKELTLNDIKEKDYSKEFKAILSDYKNRSCFLKIAIEELNIKAYGFPTNSDKEKNELKDKLEDLDKIIYDNEKDIEEIAEYYDILRTAIKSTKKNKRLENSLKLYWQDRLKPNLARFQLASAIVFENDNILRKAERIKFNMLKKLEGKTIFYDELKEQLSNIIGTDVNSPKSLLKKLFIVKKDRKRHPKTNKTASVLKIKGKYSLDDFYGINLSKLKKRVNGRTTSNPIKVTQEANKSLKNVISFPNKT